MEPPLCYNHLEQWYCLRATSPSDSHSPMDRWQCKEPSIHRSSSSTHGEPIARPEPNIPMHPNIAIDIAAEKRQDEEEMVFLMQECESSMVRWTSDLVHDKRGRRMKELCGSPPVQKARRRPWRVDGCCFQRKGALSDLMAGPSTLQHTRKGTHHQTWANTQPITHRSPVPSTDRQHSPTAPGTMKQAFTKLAYQDLTYFQQTRPNYQSKTLNEPIANFPPLRLSTNNSVHLPSSVSLRLAVLS